VLRTDDAQLHLLDSQIVVDALPGVEPSSQLATVFLARGIDVITANKTMIAQSGAELSALAARHGAHLHYSAAVGGGAPMIETTRRLADSGQIASLTTI
jgi:homoserine dehydrogenase